MTRILVLGKGGQVSRALAEILDDRALIAGQEEIDFARPNMAAQLDAFVGNAALSAVINAAAYTNVDKAEGEGRSDAMRINGEAVGEVARWCRARKLPLVHYSTDYVFDGSKPTPYVEEDTPAPLNAYGESKLAGERALAVSGADYLLFRTSWVYDAWGKNFVGTMRRLFAEKPQLRVVADQIGAPTYAPPLAQATCNALERALSAPQFPSGIYHLTGSGETSWHGFAEAILALARKVESGQESRIVCQEVIAIPSSDYPTPARRPHNSRLNCAKAARELGVALPDWQAGLNDCFHALYEHT